MINPYLIPGINWVDLHLIEFIVTEVFDVTQQELQTKTKYSRVVIPRQVIYYLGNRYIKNDNGRVSYLCRHYNQCHATVINAIGTIESLIATEDRKWYPLIHEAEELVKQRIHEKSKEKTP